MKKKVFIIGNSPAGYALAKKMSEKYEIYITPASDTLKEFATCLDIREDNINEILEFAIENAVDITIAVSDKAINAGIADKFNKNQQPIFAPTMNSNEIISNKTSAKKVLYKLRIPTPKFGIFDKLNIALDYIKNQQAPFVIKTNDKNSAVVLTSPSIAKTIVEEVFIEKNKKLIVEDFVYGTPFSFYALTDGYKALPLGSSLNYKFSLDGDGGQLTSGMGACIPNSRISIEHEYFLMDNVIYPTLDYLQILNTPYLGILGINGILTDEGDMQILGWQSFFEDCDSAPLLDSIEDDLYELFEACIVGSFSDEFDSININNKHYVSVTLNCKHKVNSENVIQFLENLDEDTIVTYYPTVMKNRYLEYEAKNGSVMILTSFASSLNKACKKVYAEVNDIEFSSKYYRKDICKQL